LECHLRKVPGASVTLFADHYNRRPAGLPSDYWVNDSDFSFQFAIDPIKGGRLPCLRATYGDKELVLPSHTEITFTVETGTKALTLLFSVGNSPYEFGRLVEDCGDGVTHTLCEMSAEYPVATIVVDGEP
jgi:hypothetical protein